MQAEIQTMKAERGGTSTMPLGRDLGPAGKDKGEVDEAFKQSMASLSLQLAARFAESESPGRARSGSQTQRSIGSPLGRQVGLEEHASRRPSFSSMLAVAVIVTASAFGVYAFREMNSLHQPASIAMATTPETIPSPAPTVSRPPEAVDPTPPQAVVLTPRDALDPAPSEAVDPAPPAQPLLVATAPAASNQPVPTIRTADQNELSFSEVLELQRRLNSLGMRPGFLDGIPGPRTAAAIRRYEESKGQPQTGNPSRELLERLQQEPN
jgi:putative peptidoglycan binding protein